MSGINAMRRRSTVIARAALALASALLATLVLAAEEPSRTRIAPAPELASASAALAAELARAKGGVGTRDGGALERLYRARANALLWFDGPRLGADAETAVRLLRDAARFGLRADDYGAEAIAAMSAAGPPQGARPLGGAARSDARGDDPGAAGPPQGARPLGGAARSEARGDDPGAAAAIRALPPDAAAAARLDVALSLVFLRFLADLHGGRTDASPAPVAGLPQQTAFDPAAVLLDALARHRLDGAAESAEPALPIHRRLRELLARYRPLAATPWPPLPPLPGKAKKVAAGAQYAGAAALQTRLLALGDLTQPVVTDGDDRYGAPLAEAVMRFQARHGLAADGVLGKATLAALNVPPAERVRQIELALERLRRLPALGGGPVVAVNIPSYRLWAFPDPASSSTLTMAVIVGRAVRTPTPVFVGAMRYVEFNPYWNVPPSIQRKEIAPRLARDPGYFAREEMEFVDVRGRGAPITTVDASTLAALAAGKLRIRQRPGTRNALDGIKFVLPNTMNIYLHGTPAHALFARERRDFSHGCIRLADPVALASFVLRDQPEWTPARIEAAMASGSQSSVHLTAPLPVVIFYATAIVDRDGNAVFLDDVYGEDRKLDAELRRWSARAEDGLARLLR